MTISGHARLAGVIGDPIGHSLSPRLHGYWLDLYGIDGAYVPLRVSVESFDIAIAGLRAVGFAGVNVTVPHKEKAFAAANRLDAAARAAGAVNLLVFHEDGIEGRNTDIAGLASSLEERLGPAALKGKRAVVLGAGGAARAAVLALDGLEVAEIRLVARDVGRAETLLNGLSTRAKQRGFAWEDWAKAADGAGLLLNATSAGMRGKPDLSLPLDPLPLDAAICDIVYNPLRTSLLEAAEARGHIVIDGLGMLMHQAVPAFAAFYGRTPEVTSELRAELEHALARRT